MRKNLLHIWYKELTYEIREITEVASKIEEIYDRSSKKIDIIWENIWDPVEKWEKIPDWVKKIISDCLKKEKVYAYSHSKWLLETREYLASKVDNLSSDDIIFFNWLWEAINKIYWYLSFWARVIWPNPAYPTHSSSEAVNSWTEHLTYTLDPENEWNPDLEEIENKVKYNPNVTAILVINPDNPTWAVFKREVLIWIIDIARKYDLFVIFDEIYEKLTFNEKDKVLLSDIIWNVPWISMKWISKELPWPWARCWWIEIYNRDKDRNFSDYIDSLYLSKMLEVCSTTLPQYVLPLVYESDKFLPYLEKRIEKYKSRADIAIDILWGIEEISIVKPKGAFYLSVVFNLDKINTGLIPNMSSLELELYLTKISLNKRFDKRFCYYLLWVTWICAVPLSSFNSTYDWFRLTLLENDLVKYKNTLKSITSFISLFRV